METPPLWSEELTEQETNDLLDNLANQIRKRKLEAPAIVFFEMNRPISRVAGNALIVFSPFLAPIVGTQNVHNYSRLMMDPTNIESLIQRLEAEPVTEERPKEATK